MSLITACYFQVGRNVVRARPLAPIFPRVTGTLLPPYLCGIPGATGAGHHCSNWGVPTLGTTAAMNPTVCTEALCVPKPDYVF